jgi:hypothetical protein
MGQKVNYSLEIEEIDGATGHSDPVYTWIELA